MGLLTSVSGQVLLSHTRGDPSVIVAAPAPDPVRGGLDCEQRALAATTVPLRDLLSRWAPGFRPPRRVTTWRNGGSRRAGDMGGSPPGEDQAGHRVSHHASGLRTVADLARRTWGVPRSHAGDGQLRHVVVDGGNAMRSIGSLVRVLARLPKVETE
ncbi:hypothetical protein Cs7R123_79540 [Catellatospora sp. TT07R-123]|nr:hypothetical protein Cs7R123_79540 [Catellatospora sp. TT07R-123]